MKTITLIRLTLAIDIAKLCDYQQKQLIKTLSKRLNQYRKEYETGTLKPDGNVIIETLKTH